ncbi:MAG: cardiolipin synthase [Lachnospiraceae bacterium]|nr:cardiolipin synthase [Lachnospiraceae bacterium]
MSSVKETSEAHAQTKNDIGRLVIAGVSIVLEIVVILLLVLYVAKQAWWILLFFRAGAFALVLYIYARRVTPAMKMPWLMVITLLPICGATLYFLIGHNRGTKKMKERYAIADSILERLLPEKDEVIERAEAFDKRVANINKYIKKEAGYPVYDNTSVTYYDDGAKGLAAQKEELRKAQSFIFMEYFAIEDSESWRGVEEILEERAKAGVEIRIFYDDMGSIGYINKSFIKKLADKGIKARIFNPFMPGLNLFLNNRDHRKITIIDGQVGFTGGYNLADEYFHVTEPFGFWKDTGVRLEGEAVKSLTGAFLEMWNATSDKDGIDKDVFKYLPEVKNSFDNAGFVQFYGCSPMFGATVGEDVYISIANAAQDYVWFITPYLIITDEMTAALSLAAKRGVDVRVITPGIPDKKMIYSVTRSYYNGLVRNGVKVYEFTPGFCHCKMSVMDGILATCGTINMDYRSLYHHFENGCLIADNQAVADIKRDFEETIGKCRDVTEQYRTGRGEFLRPGQVFLRLIAPLL